VNDRYGDPQSPEVNSTFTLEPQTTGSPHSGKGEPLICDFWIAKIVEEITENRISKTASSGDVVRYSATELIEGGIVPVMIHSDMYSIAMVILECIMEEMPFSLAMLRRPRDGHQETVRLGPACGTPRARRTASRTVYGPYSNALLV